MKYKSLQLRYIQRREKAFDICPEVTQIQAKPLVIFTTMFYVTRKDSTSRTMLESLREKL